MGNSQSVDGLWWFGEKLSVVQDQVLYTVWSVFRESRTVRFTLPLHALAQCTKKTLMVTDAEQKLL